MPSQHTPLAALENHENKKEKSPSPETITEEDLTCAICLHVMQQPVQLFPCSHSFCKSCVFSVYTKAPQGSNTKCVACRDDWSTTTRHFLLDTMIDRYLKNNPALSRPIVQVDEKKFEKVKKRAWDCMLKRLVKEYRETLSKREERQTMRERSWAQHEMNLQHQLELQRTRNAQKEAELVEKVASVERDRVIVEREKDTAETARAALELEKAEWYDPESFGSSRDALAEEWALRRAVAEQFDRMEKEQAEVLEQEEWREKEKEQAKEQDEIIRDVTEM